MSLIKLPSDGAIPASSLRYKNRCAPEKKAVGSDEIAAEIAASLPNMPMKMIKETMAYVAEELSQRLLAHGQVVWGKMLYRLVSIDGQPVDAGEIAPEDKGLFVVDVTLTSKHLSPKKNT